MMGRGPRLVALCAAASTFPATQGFLASQLNYSEVRSAAAPPPIPCMHARRCLIERHSTNARSTHPHGYTSCMGTLWWVRTPQSQLAPQHTLVGHPLRY